MKTKTKTQSLEEFIDHPERRIESIYIRSRAMPNGKMYRENLTDKGEDYCDCCELLCTYNLSPTDLLALEGGVEGDSWTWDGKGKVKDYFGNSITLLRVTASRGAA